jgi:hypothetical protein
MARKCGGDYAARDAEAGEDDDPEDHRGAYGYAAAEIEKDGLHVHRDSVNLIGVMRNVTLVSTMVRAVL